MRQLTLRCGRDDPKTCFYVLVIQFTVNVLVRPHRLLCLMLHVFIFSKFSFLSDFFLTTVRPITYFEKAGHLFRIHLIIYAIP